MKNVLWITSLVLCAGCICEPRQARLCRVLDVDGFRPIAGATVWMQPYAPIHPFWPLGDKGVSDVKGDVTLSLPWDHDFWFYLSGVTAKGYSAVHDVRLPGPTGDTWAVFYMKRDR